MTDTATAVPGLRLPGLTVEELTLTVPVDRGYGQPLSTSGTGEEPATLEVFARILGTKDSAKPYLLYLQGGPGHEAFRATQSSPGWIERALKDFRIVMLDQRGTGRSTPIGWVDGHITGLPAGLDATDPEAVAGYLTHLRADSIIADAEDVRQALGAEQWSVLGQSFGGFCTLRYLNEHPEVIREALFTGGLPAVGRHPREVYAATWQQMTAKSRAFTARYPRAAEKLKALSARAESGLELPDGTIATPDHVRLLGHFLGASGGAERLAYLLEGDIDTAAFRYDFAAALPFSGRNPLYAVVHESCWADGGVTDWAAEAAMPEAVRTDPTLLAGEHMTPAVFSTGPLAVWKDIAERVAAHEWPKLWDAEKLRRAEVPAAAAVYFEDAYVPQQYSLETASLLPQMRPWVTNEYEHNGLSASSGAVLDRLLKLTRDEI